MRYILILLLLTGCATRKVQKTQEKIRLIETRTLAQKSPGDEIYFEVPKVPQKRPKSARVEYQGKDKKATAYVQYDSIGNIASVLARCPEIETLLEENSDLVYELKDKQSTREFNMAIAKEIKSTLIWISAIFALAMVVKGVLKSIIS